MGNCCRCESSTFVGAATDRRSPPSKSHGGGNHSGEEAQKQRLRQTEDTASSSSSAGDCLCSSGEGGRFGFGAVKIKMTKRELEELVGWLNMADSSFEQVMARLVNVISSNRQEEDDDHGGQAVRLRQSSWKPSLRSIPEII